MYKLKNPKLKLINTIYIYWKRLLSYSTRTSTLILSFLFVNGKNNPQLLMLLEHTVASFDRLQVSVEKEEARGTKWRDIKIKRR